MGVHRGRQQLDRSPCHRAGRPVSQRAGTDDYRDERLHGCKCGSNSSKQQQNLSRIKNMARPCNGLLDRIEPDGLEENIGAGSSSTDHRVTAPGGRSANGRARTIIETNAIPFWLSEVFTQPLSALRNHHRTYRFGFGGFAYGFREQFRNGFAQVS